MARPFKVGDTVVLKRDRSVVMIVEYLTDTGYGCVWIIDGDPAAHRAEVPETELEPSAASRRDGTAG
jgi:uncharacterized protein YodC (DUF2158 family)